jgi:hypothetical protein
MTAVSALGLRLHIDLDREKQVKERRPWRHS